MTEDASQALADPFVEGAYVQAVGESAVEATGKQQFAAVLCPGVLMHQSNPEPLLDALCPSAEPDGLVSVMALNATTMAVRPALERRWADALAAFDATHETRVLGTPTRGDTVEDLTRQLRRRGVEAEAWYGV